MKLKSNLLKWALLANFTQEQGTARQSIANAYRKPKQLKAELDKKRRALTKLLGIDPSDGKAWKAELSGATSEYNIFMNYLQSNVGEGAKFSPATVYQNRASESVLSYASAVFEATEHIKDATNDGRLSDPADLAEIGAMLTTKRGTFTYTAKTALDILIKHGSAKQKGYCEKIRESSSSGAQSLKSSAHRDCRAIMEWVGLSDLAAETYPSLAEIDEAATTTTTTTTDNTDTTTTDANAANAEPTKAELEKLKAEAETAVEVANA